MTLIKLHCEPHVSFTSTEFSLRFSQLKIWVLWGGWIMVIWLLSLMGNKAWHQPDVARKSKLVLKKAVPIPTHFQWALCSPEPACKCYLQTHWIHHTFTVISMSSRTTNKQLISDLESKVTHMKYWESEWPTSSDKIPLEGSLC